MYCGKKLTVKEIMFNPINGKKIASVLSCPDWKESKFCWLVEIPSPHSIFTLDLKKYLKNNG